MYFFWQSKKESLMKIIFNRKAEKELQSLPKYDIEKILNKIFLLWWNDLWLDIKKMHPWSLELYRLRVGTYRIIFKYWSDTIVILKINTRESIYENL